MVFYYMCPNILFSACENNQTEIIRECIKNGYEIDKQNFLFQTPLIIATIEDNFDAVKIFAEYGADLNIIDIFGSTALGYAKDQSKVQEYLTSKGAKRLRSSTEDMSHLITEIKNKDSFSTTTKEIINKMDSWGLSPFMWAIWHESETHFKNYLELGADVNQKCRNGTTPLMLACFHNNYNMVERLIEKGASVNDVNDNGNPSLIYCTSSFSSKIADLLIERGADINMNNSIPLIVAAISNNLYALEYFLNKKAYINAIDTTGNTALAYAAYFGRINYVKMLIENRADIDLCGPKGKTPLAWSATGNNLEMMKFLLRNSARIYLNDYQNNTVFSYAKQYDHFEIINYLKQKTEETTPLCSAIQQDNFKLVKSLIEAGEDSCEIDKTGNTPLMAAIRVKNQKIVKYLLENGADLTVHSALPTAIELDDLEILKILIENGANVNRCYKSVKKTPLMQTISLRNLKMVEFLVEHGADVNLNGNTLRTAIELKCNYNIIKLLIEKGADINETLDNQPSLLKLAIKQKNLRLIVLLINHGANVKKNFHALKHFARENDDFMEFFNKKIASQFKSKKNENNT